MIPSPPPVRPGPFLKWAGGKGRLLAQYRRHFPARHGDYHEPFLGSAAVFFHLHPEPGRRRVRLSDLNEELVHVYRCVQQQVEPLIERLAVHRELHGEEHYYRVRAQAPEALAPVERAARLIYLNKTCYNGLYRVNRQGRFNVPFGRQARPAILDEARLRAASRALEGVTLEVDGFEGVLERARPGDLVYFDPPYQPVSPTARFTAYTRWSFGEAEQRRLAEVFARLASRGVQAMLSNSSTPLVEELYRGFRQVPVVASRAINARGDRRGATPELLVLSWP